MLIFLFPFPILAKAPDYLSKTWLRLLHYEKDFLGNYESNVDSSKFFISKNGKYSPKEEFETSLRFAENSDFACKFPLRFEFLRTIKKDFKRPKCPNLEKFIETMKADKLSIVFSSYYASNPASLFGHTFLKIIRIPPGHTQESSDVFALAINFGAEITSKNPLVYAFNGLFGNYKGVYSLIPYYYKLREYNDLESRDLWEFELDFSKEEVRSILLHFWELKTSYYDYYYLSENCSYHMLTLLEGALPELDITKRLNRYVIPYETITALDEISKIKSFRFSPSSYRVAKKSVNNLDASEKKILREVVEDNVSNLEKIKRPESKIKVLDATINLFDYKFSSEIALKDASIQSKRRELILQRAKIDLVSKNEDIPIPIHENPRQSHKSMKVKLGYRESFGSNGALLSYRGALHNTEDMASGFPSSLSLSVLDLDFFINEDRKIFIHKLDVVKIEKIDTSDSLFKPVSWKLSLGNKREFFQSDHSGRSSHLTFGYGKSVNKYKLTTSLMGVASLGHGSRILNKKARIGMGANLILNLKLAQKFLINSELEHGYDFLLKKIVGQYSINLNYYFKLDYGVNLGSNYFPYKQDPFEHHMQLSYYW